MIPAVSTRLRLRDKLCRWGLRWSYRRSHFRVAPGLYRVGNPDAASPVRVTANYRMTFDVLRSELPGVTAWILVLDTKGVNVWCAAGKGSFGTVELCERVRAVGLTEIVTHRKLILPQLGAPGVAAHVVESLSGFKVVYGPVHARDIKAFLDAGLRATEEMRCMRFDLGDRLAMIGGQVVPAFKWLALIIVLALLFGASGPPLARLIGALRWGAPILKWR